MTFDAFIDWIVKNGPFVAALLAVVAPIPYFAWRTTRHQNQRAVRPYLSLHPETKRFDTPALSGVEQYVLELKNSGNGLALIELAVFSRADGMYQSLSDENMRSAVKTQLSQVPGLEVTVRSIGAGSAIAKDEKRVLIELKASSLDASRAIDSALTSAKVDVRLEYSSLAGEKFVLDTRYHKGVQQHLRPLRWWL